MKTALQVLLSLFLYLNGTAQTIKTDTSVIDIRTKTITQYEKNRIIETTIFGKDTFRLVDHSPYYKNYMDSLRSTNEYLKRDTISFDSDFIFIHIVSQGGCFVKNYSHLFFYYNSKLASKQKSIMIYCDLIRKNNTFSYISQGQLSSIIHILNSNMAFNIKGMGKEVLPDQQFYTTGMGKTEMIIIASENKRFLENKMEVDQNYFGFGWNIYSQLHKIELGRIVNNNDEDIQDFFDKNRSVLNEKEYVREMVGMFKNNQNKKNEMNLN